MALIKQHTTNHGVQLDNAYFRIKSINLDDDNQEARILVSVFHDKITRDNNGNPYENLLFKVIDSDYTTLSQSLVTVSDMSLKDLIKTKGYEVLKTLPEMIGAVDEV